MNFLELAEKRYSVRDYADKNVEEEKLKKILAAAHAAPTAANLQPVRLLVLQTKEHLAKLENLQISIMHHWQSLYVPTQKKHGRDHMMANRQQTLTPPL